MLVGALILFAATAQAVPEQPDFSGRWVLEPAIAAQPGTVQRLVVEQPIARTNVYGEAMKPAYLRIVIYREGAALVGKETRVIGTVGGTVGDLTKENGRIAAYTGTETLWQGDSLVFGDRTYGLDGPGTGDWYERREVWSLEADGKLLVEISTESWNSGKRVDVYRYHRETPPEPKRSRH